MMIETMRYAMTSRGSGLGAPQSPSSPPFLFADAPLLIGAPRFLLPPRFLIATGRQRAQDRTARCRAI